MINDRMSTILDAVVHLYIDNAEPVSSEMILTFYDLPVSLDINLEVSFIISL